MSEIESLTEPPKHWNKYPCPYCGGKVIFTSNAYIYHGKTYGNGKCYVCTNCRTSCGVHGKPVPTKRPLGILATDEMKQLKQQCHSKFDEVWRDHKLKRGACYKRLAKLMNIKPQQCHFGWFNVDDLKRANAILSDKGWFE